MIIRASVATDVPAMAELQNLIIRIGGTTAYEIEQTVGAVRAYVDGAGAISCFVAECGGRLIGFQSLGHWPSLPEGWADIGTFVDPDARAKGAGKALFEETKDAARTARIRVINASIRSDNQPGLAFYARLGFRDYATDPEFTLLDGRRVGRVHRRFDL